MEEKPSAGIRPHLDKLTLGVTRILETSPGVSDVTLVEKKPADRHAIISWEQKKQCVLLQLTHSFPNMFQGFFFLLSGNEDKPEKPHFDSRSFIFELDPCNGNGKVCLVYKHTKPVVSPDTEIWFLDRALYWHFLTKTFTAYYRLLITHLGLPQWQYAFTSYGVSPQAKQWFNMYKPITINTTLLSEEADSFVNKLDPNKVFKSKNKTPVMKKKQPSQPAGVQKSNTIMSSTKTSSLAGNSSRKRDPQI
ncbi:tubulin polyglutamylase complex subunit 2 isoform X2 [Lagopus leucura]|uniref:tubulin polyglutamylase complex subunit 2 isoform X2 n=1 Tax=Lagopus leucura TaxID=30410 RepID=UPI001C66870D|nr:tubulin polyglutamylase complex subunit 2 isoform X2 [Lagopus leucura]